MHEDITPQKYNTELRLQPKLSGCSVHASFIHECEVSHSKHLKQICSYKNFKQNTMFNNCVQNTVSYSTCHAEDTHTFIIQPDL